MSEHTPGQWQTWPVPSNEHGRIWLVESENPETPGIIAEVYDSSAGEADARLIAAAPELERACRVALAALEVIDQGDSETGKLLRAAIAKATGQGEK